MENMTENHIIQLEQMTYAEQTKQIRTVDINDGI